MSKKLFIAEKPSLGSDIATALGGGTRKNGYIEGDDWIVSWVFGHVLKTLMPDEIDDKYKGFKAENLPITFENIPMKVDKDAASQVKILKSLLNQCSSAVNCGDAGREGQLLVDELFDYFNFNKPVERLWLNDMSSLGIKTAVNNLRPGEDYSNLSSAAYCRRDADYWVGLTLTALFTLLKYNKTQEFEVQNTGRVMTPVLYMVVMRDKAIENFKPKDYFELHATFNGVSVKWDTPSELLDAEGFLTNKASAKEVFDAVNLEGEGLVSKANYSQSKTSAPMPPVLSDLQKEFNRLWGWTASKTLSVMQKLYATHKMTSYPRADDPYLSTEQQSLAKTYMPGVMRFISKDEVLRDVDFTQSHAVFNDKKLGEHHAIIPTGVNKYSSLSADEKKAFDYIAMRFIAVFLPPKVTNRLSVEITSAAEIFKGNLSQVTEPGWDGYLSGRVADSKALPQIKKDSMLPLDNITIDSKKTKKPPRFTEATLISAMQNASKFLPNEDIELKKELDKVDGLGTPATQASIIEKLKKIKVIKVSARKLVSTEKGQGFIKNSIDEITSPAMTSNWERMLKQVENGEMTREHFMSTLKTWLTNIVDHFKESGQLDLKLKSKADKNSPPTPAQLKFAESIAQQLEIKLSDEEQSSGFLCSKFIDKHKSKYQKLQASNPKPPSSKQLEYAKSLAETKGLKLPPGADKNWKTCSDFITKAKKS